MSDKDWAEIRKHPVISYEVVKQIDFLKDKAISILYHHERIDGKGYPFGKKEEEIPLFARILSVADSYDAMTTDRPYKKALTDEQSLDELEKNKGGQFDAKVCDVMIEIIKAQTSRLGAGLKPCVRVLKMIYMFVNSDLYVEKNDLYF